jgi:Tfp pilus assembly protein PilF
MSLRTVLLSAMRSKSFVILVGLSASAGAAAYFHFEPGRAQARHRANGDRYLKEKRAAEAILEYRSSLQNEPNSGLLHARLADAYRQSGDFARAGDAFRHAADLSTSDVQLLLQAGWYSLVQQRPADARRYAEKVLALEPNNASAQRLLANALAALGDIDGGIDTLQRSAELEPLRGATFANIGLLQAAKGNNTEADNAFARATQLGWGGSTAGGGFGAALLGGSTGQQDRKAEPDPARPPITINRQPNVIEEAPGGGLGFDGQTPVVTGTVAKGSDDRPTVRFETIDNTTGQSIQGPSGGHFVNDETPKPSPVPEPGSVLLLTSGGLIAAGARWLRQRRSRNG